MSPQPNKPNTNKPDVIVIVPKRTKPDKVKAEKYIKDKHSIKTHKVNQGESITLFIARIHGVSIDELKSCGVNI